MPGFDLALLAIRERNDKPFCGEGSQVSRNNQSSRTVPNRQSPEVRRKMHVSENNGAVMSVGSPELELENRCGYWA
jgi:hypothetical protein